MWKATPCVSAAEAAAMGMMGSSSAGSVSITLKDDASVDTDTYVQNLRERPAA